MDPNVDALAMKEPDIRITDSRLDDLRETLQKVDEMIEEFYEIHAGLIRDKGCNP